MFSPAEYPLDQDSQDPWQLTNFDGTYNLVSNETLNRHQEVVDLAKTLDNPFKFPKMPILFSDLTDLKGYEMANKITEGWFIVIPVS